MRPRKAFAILLPFCASAATMSLGAPSPRSSADVSAQASSDSLRPALRLLSRHGGHHSVDAGEDDKGDRAAFGMSMSATNSTVGAHNLIEALAEHADTHSASAEAEHGGHEHHHSHAPALLELNETKILDSHAPDPPSYWDYDHGEDGKPALLYVHIALMTVAYFGLLPLALFLKAGRSALHVIAQAAFLAIALIGLFFGQVYNGLTPNMYENSSHTSWGWFTVIVTVALNVVDVSRFFLRFTRWGRQSKGSAALESDRKKEENLDESTPFRLGGDGEDEDEIDRMVASPTRMDHPASPSTPSSSRGNSIALSDGETVVQSDEADWHAGAAPATVSATSSARKWLRLGLMGAERSLVLLAWVEVCSGIAVWSGSCRGNYRNGCLAHIIKGSIFLWYGLLTFARYCGAFSSLGWAWNRHPSTKTIWTAEFVESLVIFTYGATNTWMERMGKTGAYSIKDVQHISIAIMFWAAGALGMLLESRTVRGWLSTPAAEASGRPLGAITPPPSAAFSFNPFPALCIGVTGVAMAAHHQDYQFQVDIHALWGNLLGAFAFFRFLTYFFLYLRPPSSILPSRPPTEALASLCLTCGGVVFILSVEQVMYSAMRHHADDVMAFLNLTVALVCSWFVWTAILFAIKGWALARSTATAPPSLHAKLADSP